MYGTLICQLISVQMTALWWLILMRHPSPAVCPSSCASHGQLGMSETGEIASGTSVTVCVCVCVCLCVCVNVCTYLMVCMCVCVYSSLCLYVCMWCVFVYVLLCVYL